MLKNVNALKDIHAFIKKIKWYWLFPIIGYFYYTYDLHKFMKSKNVVILNNDKSNPNYVYSFFKITVKGTAQMAEDVQIYTSWITRIYAYSLFTIFFVVIAISIVINIQLLLTIILIPIFIKKEFKP